MFTATPQVQGDEWRQPTLPNSANVETRETTSEPEITPTAPIPSESNTVVASDSPSPDKPDESTTVAPIEKNETVVNTGEATLIPTEISRRVNESWAVLDGSYSSTTEAESAGLTLAATTTLAETMALIPPGGLPVTGVIFRRGMNWGAVAVVVLLVGAGVAALFYPRPGRR